MKHILSLSLMAGLLVGCPDTDKYEQGPSTTPEAASGGDTAFIPSGGQNSTTGGVAVTGGTAGAVVPGGQVAPQSAGAQQIAGLPIETGAGQAVAGGEMGTETGGRNGGGTVAGGAPMAGGQIVVGGTPAMGGQSNPFVVPTGGQNSANIPDRCTVRFVVTTPASTPAGNIFIAGTFNWPNPQDIPEPMATDEWTMNGDCKDPIPADADPNALRCNWNPGDPQLRLERSGTSATFEYELPHLSRVEYKFTRGAWCAVEKTNACNELATNRRYTVNCAGENPKTVEHTVENWNDVCMNTQCL